MSIPISPSSEAFLKHMNFQEFFHMGGYAVYVWTSYGLCFAVLVFNLITPLRRKNEMLKSLRRQLKQESRP
ncbi:MULTISPECIES: heme exporter protein CcmD [Methylococcus]|uniref:Heme exporter protein D n=2 Tax=Methylococcus capsulatus TaxID=414 RepID=Q60BP5_METCA|nr:heme exporter protein CcmD [Methylococcus capsulatus]AAU90412.1 putative heme exporter protein CcmD [Methylococcus capsulatus str. Bath]